jgi:hypothetical protein
LRISAATRAHRAIPPGPSDTDDVDFSTGSVGLGVAQTLFSSLVQDYVRAHGWGLKRPEGRMIALVGDAELDEGNIFEAMLEGWKQGLRNCWWVVDYNRQSLDAVVREGLWERYEHLFENFGWDEYDGPRRSHFRGSFMPAHAVGSSRSSEKTSFASDPPALGCTGGITPASPARGLRTPVYFSITLPLAQRRSGCRRRLHFQGRRTDQTLAPRGRPCSYQ